MYEYETEVGKSFVAVVLVVILAVLLAIITGCRTNRLDGKTAALFAEFNADAQAAVRQCRRRPDMCHANLELVTAELQIWAAWIADPNE